MKFLAAVLALPLLLASCEREKRPDPPRQPEEKKGSENSGSGHPAVPGSQNPDDFAIGEEEPAPEPVTPPAN